MSFFDLIASRHSVRAFDGRNIADGVIQKITNAATKADSAGNLQSYQIFIITKNEDKNRLASAAHDQAFIGNASCAFVFCADPQNAAQEYGKRGEELYCIQDATISCTYAQLAAHQLGLASVWIGSFDEEQVSKILGLAQTLRPIAMLIVGFAAESPEITPRKPLSKVIHTL